MKQELDKLWQEQNQLKQLWKRDKNRYISIIYESVLKHKTTKQIHKSLFDATINPNKVLLAYMFKVADKAKKLDKGVGQYYGSGGLDVLAIALFNLFKKNKVNEKSIHLINNETRKYESKQKEKILVNSWKENRKNGNIFYIASSHADCAEDHKDYQGKIYVDRYWNNYNNTGELGKFIRDNDIKTAQWVTSKPVYFITRPNCRHYFVNYSINDILSGNYHIPNRKIGDKRLQTPRKATLEYYEDRLRLLLEMYKKHPTDILKKQIEKTKLLISKLKKLF